MLRYLNINVYKTSQQSANCDTDPTAKEIETNEEALDDLYKIIFENVCYASMFSHLRFFILLFSSSPLLLHFLFKY